MATTRSRRLARRAVRRTVLVIAAVTAVAAAVGLAGLAGAVDPGGPVTPVRIGQLDRGDGPTVPRVVGTALVEGDRVVDVDADEVRLLGVSGTDRVVATYADRGSAVERVAPDGTRTRVLDRVPYAVALSGDGTQLVSTKPRGMRRTVLAVRDSTTGRLLVKRTFGSSAAGLDADDGRVVVGQTGPARTLSWQVATDRVERVSDRTGYAADISSDRLAVFTAGVRDVYDVGCSVVSRLSAPGRTTWRSCSEAVLAISPDGRRLMTSDINVDGPLGRVEVRTPRGRLVAAYDASGGLGVLGWEDPHTVLVTAYDRRGRSALVRCDRGVCERASDVVAP